MARQLRERRLVVASHNPGKVAEIKDLLAPYGIETLSAAELDLPEPEETGDTFAGNALLKARAGATGADMVALADDSGLQVSALDGAPGLRSARWAGPERDFDLAMARVEKELSEKGAADAKSRAACFVAAFAFALFRFGAARFALGAAPDRIWLRSLSKASILSLMAAA